MRFVIDGGKAGRYRIGSNIAKLEKPGDSLPEVLNSCRNRLYSCQTTKSNPRCTIWSFNPLLHEDAERRTVSPPNRQTDTPAAKLLDTLFNNPPTNLSHTPRILTLASYRHRHHHASSPPPRPAGNDPASARAQETNEFPIPFTFTTAQQRIHSIARNKFRLVSKMVEKKRSLQKKIYTCRWEKTQFD